jgi:hypothetical protein
VPGEAKQIVFLKCPESCRDDNKHGQREDPLLRSARWSLERVNMNMKLNQRTSFLINSLSLSLYLSPPPQPSGYNKRKQHSSSLAGLSLAERGTLHILVSGRFASHSLTFASAPVVSIIAEMAGQLLYAALAPSTLSKKNVSQ